MSFATGSSIIKAPVTAASPVKPVTHTTVTLDTRGSGKSGSRSRGGGRGGRGNGPNRGPPGSSRNDVLCWKCGKKGHISRRCPKIDDGGELSAYARKSYQPKPPPGLVDEDYGTFAAFSDLENFDQLVAEYEDLMRKRRACDNDNDRGEKIPVSDVTASGVLADGSLSMVISSHSFSNNEVARRKPLLFDTGSNVNITPDYGDFEQASIMDLSKRLYPIITGGGRVKAKAFGLSIEYLTGPDGSRRSVRLAYCLWIPDFPVKIFSGKRWYNSGGMLQGDNIVNAQGKPVTTINTKTRGFYLWRFGEPEPRMRIEPDRQK
jgi:hypothetical protein